MDPEAFKTPWKVIPDEFCGNATYLISDKNGTTVAIIGNEEHAQFICSRVNAYFEGL